MVVLVDTNVLLRLHTPTSPHHAESVALFEAVRGRPHPLVICGQVLVEFWTAATRPQDRNGLGMDVDEVSEAVTDLLDVFVCSQEPPDVATRWLSLVRAHRVSGRPAYDARLIAFMAAYGITDLVTFNTGDFARYTHVRCHTPAEALRSGLTD